MAVQLMVLQRNMKQNAHLTINANALCPMKTGYATTWNAKIFFKWWMQAFLYEILTNTPKQI